jgi:hypothetical protein
MKIFICFLSSLFLLIGCSDDNNPVNTNNQTIYGKWEVTGHEHNRYYIFKTDNTWYQLLEYYGARYIFSGVCTISEDQVDFGGSIMNYTITSNILTLTTTNDSITAVRNDNVPDETNWIKSAVILDSIELDRFYGFDIAYDGTNIWTPYYSKNQRLLKINTQTGDTSGIPLSFRCGGVEWDGSHLWCCDYMSQVFRKVSPADGSILFTSSLLPAEPDGIAFDGSTLLFSSHYSPVYKYSPELNSIVDSIQSLPNTRFAFANGHLYYTSYGNIHAASLNPFRIIMAYEVPGKNFSGIVYDGTYFWVTSGNKIYKLLLE